ncbi:MAG: DUF6686 family protein [Bacteroidota bacterium]
MSCLHPPERLYDSEHGAVLRCKQCGRFNVLFGPVILTHSRQGFEEFCDLIRGLNPDADSVHHGASRCYHLHTPDRQFGLAFTQEEVDELRELLAGALAMDELDGLLDETLGPPDDET